MITGEAPVSLAASSRVRVPAGFLLLFALRLGLSLFRSGPVLVADEAGYLTNARVLAGGLAGQLEQAPFYRGGYSLLLWPIVELGAGPSLTYHLALVLNAVLAASVFPLLYLLLTRFAAVPARIAIIAAFAGAMYPAVTVLSEVTMSENAMFPLICLWLITFAGLIEAGRDPRAIWWALGLGACTAGLWAVHNRMLVVLALTVAATLWLGIRGRLRPSAVLAVLALVAAGVAGTHLLDAWLIDHNYGMEATGEGSRRLGEIFRVHGLRTIAANLAGQTWYLLVASFGLAAVVAAAPLAGRRRRNEGGERTTMPAVVPLSLALTVGLLLISAAAFPERTRPDMLIYGRYSEVVTPVLVALGIAILARRAPAWRPARPLAGLAALTLLVVAIRATADDPDPANRWNIAALPFVTGQLGPPILLGAMLVGAGGALLLVQIARRRPALLGLAAVCLFAAVVLYGAWNPVLKSQREAYPAGWTSPEPVAEANRIRTVSYDLDHYDTIGLYAFQWFLPNTSMRLFSGSRHSHPSQYVISSGAWPEEHPGTNATELWRAEGRDEVLWRLGL